MRPIYVLAALALTCSSCSLLRPPKAEPVQVPVRQPVECNDRAISACDGVPVREYTTAEGLALGLGESLRALLDCQDKHNELRKCVADHNAKVK